MPQADQVAMDAETLNRRLSYLVGQALKHGFCPGCLLVELLKRVNEVKDHPLCTPQYLADHGLSFLVDDTKTERQSKPVLH